MVRLLHLADVHLDTTFLCRTQSLRSRLRDALREALQNAFTCAIEEDVNAVLIAGDLFDNARLSFATERFLVEQLRRLDQAGISCFYVTGNHDPGGRAYRGGRIEWPSSFHFVGNRHPSRIQIEDDRGEPLATVVAAGHVTQRESENLARTFPEAAGGLPHIGLLHSYVTSAEALDGHDRYAPCSLEDLRRTGYRYWALGHIHRRQQVCEVAEAWYPGNLQGRNPRETGPKGGLLVTLDGSGRPHVEFRSFAPIEWLEVRVDDLADVFTLPDLERRIRTKVEQARNDDAMDCLVRVHLEGRTPLADDLQDDDARRDLEEVLSGSIDVLDLDLRLGSITPPVDVEKFKGEPHLLGAVLSLLEEAADEEEVLESLAPDVLASPIKDKDERIRYLRMLLADLDAEAVARIATDG